jgi:hypothetical protein
MYDFGGQDIFYSLHPYFMTPVGVYVVVFNMCELRNKQPDETPSDELVRKQRCLQYLSFWLNSIAVNTRHILNDEPTIAPIILVGTHEDKVSSAIEQEGISEILRITLSSSTSWPFISPNSSRRLTFFPVDNTATCPNQTVQALMELIAAKIKASPHLAVKRPLRWFKVIDLLGKYKASAVDIQEVRAVAARCDVEASTVPLLLQFLHDMGIVMWFREDGLQGTIILDPIKYFVIPMTRVICDPKVHWELIHKKCLGSDTPAYTTFVEQHVASKEVLESLLIGDGPVETPACLILIKLMLKFGLLVPWTSVSRGTPDSYLVPSLLLLSSGGTSPSTLYSPLPRETKSAVYSFYLVFTLDAKTAEGILKEEHLRRSCFLPTGIFEQLMALAFTWSQLTPDTFPKDMTLRKDLAILPFGNVWFRMVHRPHFNCIQVDVWGSAVLTVMARLLDMLKKIIISNMQRLYVTPYVTLAVSGKDLYVAVESLMYIIDKSLVVRLPTGDDLDSNKVVQNFPWTTRCATLIKPFSYDLFISYPLKEFIESRCVDAVIDHLKDFVKEQRALKVFPGAGERFRSASFKALMGSMLMTPFVTPSALERMLDSKVNPSSVDNLLVEWLSALVFIKFKEHLGVTVLLKSICPICFIDAAENSYFTLKEELSTESPRATLEEVKDMFISSFGLATNTVVIKWIEEQNVKSIVESIMSNSRHGVVSIGESLQSVSSAVMEIILGAMFPKDRDSYGPQFRDVGPFPQPETLDGCMNVDDSSPELNIESTATGLELTREDIGCTAAVSSEIKIMQWVMFGAHTAVAITDSQEPHAPGSDLTNLSVNCEIQMAGGANGADVYLAAGEDETSRLLAASICQHLCSGPKCFRRDRTDWHGTSSPLQILLKSPMFVPIITTATIQLFCQLNVDDVDGALSEWICALAAFDLRRKYAFLRPNNICPIDARPVESMLLSPFPHMIPKACIATVTHVLKTVGVTVEDSYFAKFSLSYVVQQILQFSGISVSDYLNSKMMPGMKASTAILRRCGYPCAVLGAGKTRSNFFGYSGHICSRKEETLKLLDFLSQLPAVNRSVDQASFLLQKVTEDLRSVSNSSIANTDALLIRLFLSPESELRECFLSYNADFGLYVEVFKRLLEATQRCPVFESNSVMYAYRGRLLDFRLNDIVELNTATAIIALSEGLDKEDDHNNEVHIKLTTTRTRRIPKTVINESVDFVLLPVHCLFEVIYVDTVGAKTTTVLREIPPMYGCVGEPLGTSGQIPSKTSFQGGASSDSCTSSTTGEVGDGDLQYLPTSSTSAVSVRFITRC